MNDGITEFDALLQEKRALEKSARLSKLHWFIILGSLALTFGAWYYAKSQVQEKVQTQFLREAEQAVELVIERLQKYEDALWSGVAAIHAQSQGITSDEWKRFSDALNLTSRYPGINGIGVIYHVADKEELDAFITHERQNRPDFHVHPAHDKEEFWPITYIEPIENNKQAVGLDMAHEKNRFEAAQKACDTGEAQITGQITLVQDAEKTPGFLFYAPFYKNQKFIPGDITANKDNFVGMVYAAFIVKNLMSGTLEKERRHVGIQIIDDGQTLYNEHIETEPDYDPNPLFKKQYDVNIYGRTWVFDIWSTKSFLERTQDGKPIMILIGGIIIDTLLLAFFIFITRSNENAIRFANKMTDGYQQKNKELEDLIERLTDSNQELERFAYVAAHDMQEPLRMTANFSDLLKKEYLDKLDEQGQAFLNYCQEGTSRLQGILDDLLEYSRVENSDDAKETIDTQNVLKTVLDNLKARIEETDADIHTSEMPAIYCNPIRFSRVIQNLIVNGLKYQPAGNKPVIYIDASETDQEWIFSVKDNGIGIDEKYQDQVFKPFKRLHTSSEYSGTGIGLAICAKIIAKSGGKLWLESEKNKGSTFYFTIPKPN